MKKLLLPIAALFLAAFTNDAKAQDIVISNTSCQSVMIDISADVNCKQTAQSIPYKIPSGGTLKLSMYAGGTYPQVDWSAMGPLITGSDFTAIKVYNAPTDPVPLGYLFNPCWGSPTFTGGAACGGTMAGTSSWSSSLVMAVIY